MIPPIKVVDGSTDPYFQPEAPMTAKQAATLRELAKKTGEPFDSKLTQAQAQARIAALEEVSDH